MNTACNLAHLYIGEGEFDLAMILIQECEQEKAPFLHDWIAVAKENIKNARKQMIKE